MRKQGSRGAFRLAFCAIIAALAAVLMIIGSLFPFGVYALPMVAGALLVAVVIEYGARWALGVFAVASLVSFLLSGDKEASLYFVMFFGYYPVLKRVFESRIASRPLQMLLKFAVFNAAMVGAFFIASFVLGVPAEEYTVFGFYVPYLFLLAGNVVFWLYDRALTLFVGLYLKRLHPLFFKKNG